MALPGLALLIVLPGLVGESADSGHGADLDGVAKQLAGLAAR